MPHYPLVLRWTACLLAMLTVCAASRSLVAQTDCTPVPSGFYEGYSPITMRPFGPLTSVPPALGSRWVEVTSDGCTSELVWYPEANMHWRLVYGPHGLVSKTTSLDGTVWTISDFTYDADGRLLTKDISGPGIRGETSATYTHDALGRVAERTQTVRVEGYLLPWQPGDVELRWMVRYESTEVRAHTFIEGMLVRRDIFDLDGRLLSTEVGVPADGRERLMLTYQRDGSGSVVGIERTWGSQPPTIADPSVLAAGLGPTQLGQLPPVVERAEVLLLLGQPVTSTVTGSSTLRATADNYTDGCWLNETNSVHYDAAGLVQGLEIDCICGFCVDASLDVEAEEVSATMHHWTSGPWVRLDGTVDVTSEHQVMTPDGPREAGLLGAGDWVLDGLGVPHQLESVELLPDSEPRLGVNVQTASGTFAAGGLLFASEPARLCAPHVPDE